MRRRLGLVAKRPPNRIETLPSGIELAYWDAVGVDGQPQKRRYRVGGVDGELVPSISTIAGMFSKPALAPAAVKLQEEAVIALAKSGVDIADLTQQQLRAKLWEAGTHYDAVWGEARGRGDVAHDMLLDLTRDGKVANLRDYSADLRPWISAGMKFVHRERFEVIDTEYMVASLEHHFAGRGDLLCRWRDGRLARVDYKTVSAWKYKTKKGEPTDELEPPYPENLIALAGYELGAPESGYPASDVRMIVRLGPDGEYDITESHATEDVFLAALTAYNEKRYLTKGRPEAVAA